MTTVGTRAGQPPADRGGAGEIDAAGSLRLVQRPAGPRAVSLQYGAVQGHRTDRPLRVREVDLPPNPQPDARGDTRSPAGRNRGARRRGHLRSRAASGGHPAAHRHGLPEAQPLSGHDHRRQRALGSQVLAGLAGQPARPGRGDADQGRTVERGQGPTGRARRGPVRWAAAAVVHRPGAGGTAPGAAHGRALLGPRPHLHPCASNGPSRRSPRKSRWSS